MSLSARVVTAGELGDDLGSRPVQQREVRYHGLIWDVQRDHVDLGAAGTVKREYLGHPGAVAVLALRPHPDPVSGDSGHRQHRGSGEQLYLVKQYRHPVATTEWELPAGLLDVEGEPPGRRPLGNWPRKPTWWRRVGTCCWTSIPHPVP